MKIDMRKIALSKNARRKELAALPFAEKLQLLEQLRDRSLALAGSGLRKRRAPDTDNYKK